LVLEKSLVSQQRKVYPPERRPQKKFRPPVMEEKLMLGSTAKVWPRR
jgi:hypothetical protein